MKKRRNKLIYTCPFKFKTIVFYSLFLYVDISYIHIFLSVYFCQVFIFFFFFGMHLFVISLKMEKKGHNIYAYNIDQFEIRLLFELIIYIYRVYGLCIYSNFILPLFYFVLFECSQKQHCVTITNEN